MDTANLFFTKTTTLNARAEHLLGLVACIVLMATHWSTLDLPLAAVLFAYIDLVGTLPGLIAYHRSCSGQIAKGYYVVYDLFHSAVTQGAVIIAFIQLSGFQWALLAIPVHLCVDRSVFNNYPKPFGVAFDPVRHPSFDNFMADYAAFDSRSADWKAIKATAAVPAHPSVLAAGTPKSRWTSPT